MDRQQQTDPKDEELKRTEPDFIPGDAKPERGARPMVVGGDEPAPESGSPEGEISRTPDASRRP